MTDLFLDTHAVVWLYVGDSRAFTPRGRTAIEKSALLVSPAVKLELAYLYEIGRVRHTPDAILDDLSRRIGLLAASDDYARVVEQALGLTWTRDVFDRLIVAHASTQSTRLLTKDRIIRANYARSLW